MTDDIQSGGHFKGSSFSASYSWPASGENTDFSLWCKVGKWIGTNERSLSRQTPVKIMQEITSEFPLLVFVQVQDGSGRMARLVKPNPNASNP